MIYQAIELSLSSLTLFIITNSTDKHLRYARKINNFLKIIKLLKIFNKHFFETQLLFINQNEQNKFVRYTIILSSTYL